MLVEEEEVLDPHQGAALGSASDETVQDPCDDEGLEACRCSGPGTCHKGESLKEEQDGQSSEVVRNGHDEETADSQTEDIADYRLLYIVLRSLPFAVRCDSVVSSGWGAARMMMELSSDSHGLWNQRDDACSSGIVGQECKEANDGKSDGFLSWCPVEGVI